MPDFSNSNYWALIHDASYIANVPNQDSSYPYIIGEKLIAIPPSCSYLAVKTSWSTVHVDWVNAGVLRRQVDVNLPDETTQQIYLQGATRILLNDYTFVQYDDYVGEVRLMFKPYEWIQHLEIKVWRYTALEVISGDVNLTPVIDALTTLQTDVDSIQELLGG